jgi:hypothetical protein
MKRRGNPNWGKPESGPVVPIVTEFEKTVAEYKLIPDQYLQSSQLREWARRNRNSRFIPEPLLKARGFEIEAPDY